MGRLHFLRAFPAILLLCLIMGLARPAAARVSFGVDLCLSTDFRFHAPLLFPVYHDYCYYDPYGWYDNAFYYPIYPRRLTYLDDFGENPVYYRENIYEPCYPATDFVIVDPFFRWNPCWCFSGDIWYDHCDFHYWHDHYRDYDWRYRYDHDYRHQRIDHHDWRHDVQRNNWGHHQSFMRMTSAQAHHVRSQRSGRGRLGSSRSSVRQTMDSRRMSYTRPRNFGAMRQGVDEHGLMPRRGSSGGSRGGQSKMK